MIFAELKSLDLRRGPITALVKWQFAGQPGRPFTESVKVQPNPVVPHTLHWVVTTYALLKDLGLPVVLAILAFLFQRILHERSRSESARNALLPTATTNAVKDLLPAASAIRGLKRVLTEAESLSPEDKPLWWEKQEQALYYFLYFIKHMFDVNTAGGGFFFKDQPGERFAAECWTAVYRRAIAHFGYLQLSYTRDLMDGHESLSQFLDRIRSKDESLKQAQEMTRKVADKFLDFVTVKWSENPDNRLLQVLADVLEIESNRLYLGWYTEVEIPDSDKVKEWRASIASFQKAYPDLLHVENLSTALNAYTKAC